ncbi:MAG: hypothetical protein H6604_02635 [Flavobacteriales bacterium]|nr:hypothetical protein [Flavobacteriales bacterium]
MKYAFSLALSFFVMFSYSQNDASKIWDLLIQNKREEAYKLITKEIKKEQNPSAEQIITKIITEKELGKLICDKELVKSLANTKDVEYYIFPLNFESSTYLSGGSGYIDESKERIDYFYSNPKLANTDIVKLQKANIEKYNKNFEIYKSLNSEINSISNWQLCGTFENPNSSGIFIEYEPENHAKNDKLFDAQINGKIGWYTPKHKQQSAFYAFTNEGYGIIYMQTFIESTENQDVILDFASKYALKIFVNDSEIYSNDRVYSSTIGSNKIQFNLKKGINRLLFKVEAEDASSYLFAKITDTNGNQPNITYLDSYNDYTKSTLQELNIKTIIPEYEAFLLNKIKENPTNYFYVYEYTYALLFGGKYDQANEFIEPYLEKNPKSSILNLLKTSILAYDDEFGEREKYYGNIELNDPYYYAFIRDSKIRELEDKSIEEVNKIKAETDKYLSPFYSYLIEMNIASRNNNKEKLLELVDQIIQISQHNSVIMPTFSQFYDSLNNNPDKTVEILENIYETKFNESANNQLMSYYEKQNKKQNVETYLSFLVDLFPEHNNYKNRLVDFYSYQNKYDECIELLNESIANYPYSEYTYEKFGEIYSLKNDKKNALEYYTKSLSYNPSDNSVRKKVDDLKNKKNILDIISTKEVYDYIKAKRGKSKMKSNLGVQVLLDEYQVEVLENGGYKSKAILVYEILSERGIEEMKEYSIGYASEITKSEIVKPDGSLTPADSSYGSFVFKDLKVGDVIYIEYKNTNINSGKFYDDFSVGYYFNGRYPSLKSIFGIISPKDKQYSTFFVNTQFKKQDKTVDGLNYTYWLVENLEEIPEYENFSPAYQDITDMIKVTSIKSWSDIAKWYSELVTSVMKTSRHTENAFNEIFPNGFSQFSEYERAEKIYNYIAKNINYSSVDFRQSGYVPQTPSKTLISKLGDCKDLSTLFTVLAKQADLESKLVLVLTNDNGMKYFNLPSQDFNHCIVKVTLDNKDYFVEMTDKYAPFNTFVSSLYNAKALVIDSDLEKNKNAQLISIDCSNNIKTKITSNTTIKIEDGNPKYVQEIIIDGNYSYFNELLFNDYSEDKIISDLQEQYSNSLGKNIIIEKILDKKIDSKNHLISFKFEFSINEKLQKIGSLNLFSIPFISKSYSDILIGEQERKFPIIYSYYEMFHEYKNNFTIELNENNKFIEIPNDSNFTYKNHSFSVKHELQKQNILNVTTNAKISFETISTEEYSEFKKYVNNILEVYNQVLGFK